MPILFLNLKHGANLALFIIFIGSVIYISNNFKETKRLASKNIEILLIFITPILAIAISQSIRFNFYINNWDAPMRLFLCAPIFLAISHGWILKEGEISIAGDWFRWSIPIAIPITLVVSTYFPSATWTTHKSNYFVDPLSFCSYTLLFSFLVIITIIYESHKTKWKHIFIYVAAAIIAVYMSSTSGSRTGWLNLPVFLIICCWILKKKYGNNKSLVGLSFLILSITIILEFDNQLIEKIKLGWSQFSHYKINSMNEDTSIAMRISFYRMGITYFLEKPFAGWGDLSWLATINRDEFLSYASEVTRKSPIHGFHSEIITSMVRSGVFGLIATSSLFIVVFNRSVKGIGRQLTGRHELISINLLILISHLFLAGLVTEITNLAFLASFIGVVLAVLLGEQKYLEKNAV
jgi:O-antigen ligase